MEVQDLNGNWFNLNINKKRSRTRARSKLCESAVSLLKEIYPLLPICTEVAVKVKPGTTLYLDIFVPMFTLVVEVHGKQHFKYTPHYHKHPHRFGRACLNDALKKEWCEINHIRYLELNYNESREQWADKLRDAIR